MKAHIAGAQKPLALLYRLPEALPGGAALRAALAALGIGWAEVDDEKLSCSVGFLAGMGGRQAAPYKGEAPDTKLLLMSGFQKKQLSALLDALREAGADIPLKAVVTKHNKTWSALELLAELRREKAEVEKLADGEEEA